MSKRSAMLQRMRRTPTSAGPITRRQQVEAVRQLKGEEIAASVGAKIQEAVKQEVETQLKRITDTMFSLIDRVVDLEARQHAVLMKRVKDEGDSDSGSERTEAVPIQQDPQVVQGPGECRPDCGCKDSAEGPASG